MFVLSGVLPRAFTGDASVLDEAALLWPLFALMQPLNGAVFALDGILIGASDGPFLAVLDGRGVPRVRGGPARLARGGLGDPRRVGGARSSSSSSGLTLMTTRFRRGRWLVTGWA